jgi:hypothetical protein
MAKKTLADEVLELIQKQQELVDEMNRFITESRFRYLSIIDDIDRRIAECDKRSKEGE